jgi:hypothetical protein
MGFCYMLQYVDKVSLGYSTQLGLMKDLVRLQCSKKKQGRSLIKVSGLTWVRVQLGIIDILFRISRLVLAIVILSCAISSGEISCCLCCSLGNSDDVPWSNA